MPMDYSEYDNTLATVYIRYLEKAKEYLDSNEFDKARDIVQGIIKQEGEKDGLINFLSLIDSEQNKEYKLELIRFKINRFFNLAVIKGQAKVGNLEFFKTYKVRGWVETGINEQPLLIVRSNTNEIEVELNENRPDVVKTLAEKGKSVKLACGFNFHIDVSTGIKIGLKINETISWLVAFKLKPLIDAEKTARKDNSSNNVPIRGKNEVGVLKGKEDWLFENDSEKVDKITGKLLLNAKLKNIWLNYSSKLKKFKKDYNFLYVIASAKEKVRSDKYPHIIKGKTITEQVEAILQNDGVNYLNPIESLASNDKTFCKTASHWTDLGAYITYKQIMATSNNLNFIQSPKFTEVELVGDLGAKLAPMETSVCATFQDNPKIVIETTFDNKIKTTGGLRIHINNKVGNNKSVVIFGSSTMHEGQLTKYLSYSFSRVVEVNLAGSIIEEVVRYEQPDLVIVLNDERSLSASGDIFKTFNETTAFKKLSQLSKDKKKEISLHLKNNSEETFYINLVKAALSE